jgi:secreted trypsin-like serine protease
MAEYENQYYLVGIVSAGIAGCGNTSSLYMRVRAFVDWICQTDPNIAYCSIMNNMTSSSSTFMTSLPITEPTTKNYDGNKSTIIIVATVVPSVLVIISILVTLYLKKGKKFCFSLNNISV